MRRVVAAVVPLLLIVAACGDDDTPDVAEEPVEGAESEAEDGEESAGAEDLAAGAQEEGEVTLYIVPQEETIVNWVADFEGEYGVGVVTQRQSQNPLWERLQQEERAGQHTADVLIFNDPVLLEEARDEGWIAEFTPSTDGDYPDEAKESGNWYTMYTSGEVLAWNTSQVSDEEADMLRSEGFAALSDGTWQDRIATVAPQATGRVYATYYTLAESPEFGWDYLEALGANTSTFYESAAPLIERLVAGEHAVVLGGADTIAARPVLDGAPIEFIYPEPTTGSPFYMAISENAPNPQAARLFIEWATSPEALASVAEISGGIPAHDGVEDRRAITEVDWYEGPAALELDWANDQEMWDQQDEVLAQWTDAFGYQP